MTSTYFTIPSFARARKNKEDLEKSNPQEPVLKDEDEKFLEQHIGSDQKASQGEPVDASKITDEGEEKEAEPAEQEQVGDVTDQAVVPEGPPGVEVSKERDESEEGEGAKEGEEAKEGASYDGATKEQAEEAKKSRKDKKNKSMDLPSQEEAEAATKGFNALPDQDAQKQQGEKRTWASYIPSVRPSTGKKDESTPPASSGGEEKSKDTADITTSEESGGDKRTWTQYATSYIPSSLPSLPSLSRSKDGDKNFEPVYNEDGTVNEAASKEKQEKEVSVLLDNLHLSSINNRVFAFNESTQDIYHRFSLVLKDIINGAPTAYEDLDTLMKDAGPALEKQFNSMPPFVQTLVKSLPMKLGSTLGPELMAAASEKPGADMNSRLAAASSKHDSAVGTGDVPSFSTSPATKDGGETTAETSDKAEGEDGSKKKRKIPALKSLVSGQGVVASMLRNTVNFLQTRFPFLASTTNVVMSLSVFSKSRHTPAHPRPLAPFLWFTPREIGPR